MPKIQFFKPGTVDFDQTEKDLKDFLATQNYHIKPAGSIPLKRMAVKSGLAVLWQEQYHLCRGVGQPVFFCQLFFRHRK